jgi:hypothetical protein
LPENASGKPREVDTQPLDEAIVGADTNAGPAQDAEEPLLAL